MTYQEKLTNYVNTGKSITEFVKLYMGEFTDKPNLVILDDYLENCLEVARTGKKFVEALNADEEDEYSEDEYVEESSSEDY